jgi:hypothetical protein
VPTLTELGKGRPVELEPPHPVQEEAAQLHVTALAVQRDEVGSGGVLFGREGFFPVREGRHDRPR